MSSLSAHPKRNRGRQAMPCPDPVELRIAYASDPRIMIVARQMSASVGQVRRWLGEIGITVPVKEVRQRGVTPAYVRVARTPDGRRVVARLYEIWCAMRRRCYGAYREDFHHYGGRGIRVCDEWRTDYAAFRAWALENGYSKALTIDRIDSNGNYEPANCRWATREEQTYNTKSVHSLTLNGVTKLLPIWAKELGLSPFLLRARRSSGWTDEQILTTPRLANGQFRTGVQHKPRGRRPSFPLSAHSETSR